MNPIHLVRIATDTPAQATFQSHNQKVLQTRHGMFMTYLTLQAEADSGRDHCRWTLLRSTDGGSSFSPVYESPVLGGNKPACIEADEEGNLMAFCENARDVPNEMLFLRFTGFRDPRILKIGPSHYGKFCRVYDRSSKTGCLWNHYGRLFLVDSDLRIRPWTDVVRNDGPHAAPQYPHACLDGAGLHHAWTTQAHGRMLRWDIHYVLSRTGGRTWEKADGTPLTLPIVPDDTGPADPIVLPDELEQETWLASMLAKDGKVHFAYLAYRSSSLPPSIPPMNRQHYVRLDLRSGRIDRNLYPVWKGERVSLNGQDGFFASREGGPLVHVGRANHRSIGALVSHDNGETWQDLALSDPLPDSIYAIGGCREITDDGWVIGSFTNQRGSRGDPYFFRVRVG